MSCHNDFNCFAGLQHAVRCFVDGVRLLLFEIWSPRCFPCEGMSHSPWSLSPHDAFHVSSPCSIPVCNWICLSCKMLAFIAYGTAVSSHNSFYNSAKQRRDLANLNESQRVSTSLNEFQRVSTSLNIPSALCLYILTSWKSLDWHCFIRCSCQTCSPPAIAQYSSIYFRATHSAELIPPTCHLPSPFDFLPRFPGVLHVLHVLLRISHLAVYYTLVWVTSPWDTSLTVST